MIRFYGMAIGLCLVMSTGLRAQDSLMLQIEAQLNTPELSAPVENYHRSISPDSLNFRSPFPAMGRFAFSFNLGGMAFFGPMYHAEVGLSPKLRLDTHIRFLKAGLCYAVYQGFCETDIQVAPPVPGLGLVYCFTAPERRQPYISIMVEYDYHSNSQWQYDDYYKYWTYHLGIVGIGGGIRFRSPEGVFFGAGGYIFYGGGIEWYRDEKYHDDGEWSSGTFWMKHPWLQVEASVGIEFGSRKK